MSKVTLEQVESIIKSYNNSHIHQYYSKYGEGRASGYAKQKLYAKTTRGKQTLLKTLSSSQTKRKNLVSKYWKGVSSKQRSEWSKSGWNKEEGYEERREHIKVQAENNKEDNSKRFKEINQDSEIQSRRGKIGGKISGPMVANRVHHCNYCQEDFKSLPYNKYHGEKCKQNPNRVIVYNYELVKDGQSYGKFEEKQDIANHFKCSAALISRYMSGNKKDIKGYQIETIKQN